MAKLLRRTLVAMIALCAASPSPADVHTYKGQTTHVPHEVISSAMNFRVTHPFRIVVGNTEGVTGVLALDLADLNQGVALDLKVPVASVRTADRHVNARIAKLLAVGKSEAMKFVSSRTDVNRGAGPDQYLMTFDGTLSLGELSTPQRIGADCRTEGEAFVCAVSTILVPSVLGIPLPKLAGLVTPDAVEVDGLITFRGQK